MSCCWSWIKERVTMHSQLPILLAGLFEFFFSWNEIKYKFISIWTGRGNLLYEVNKMLKILESVFYVKGKLFSIFYSLLFSLSFSIPLLYFALSLILLVNIFTLFLSEWAQEEKVIFFSWFWSRTKVCIHIHILLWKLSLVWRLRWYLLLNNKNST